MTHTSRRDWCLHDPDSVPSSRIIFAARSGIFYTQANPQAGGAVTQIKNTNGNMFYPTYYPGCRYFAVDVQGSVSNDSNIKGPGTFTFNLAGVEQGPISGNSVWAGFPGIDAKDPTLIALAAQHFNASPNGKYQENYNYVYILNTTASPQIQGHSTRKHRPICLPPDLKAGRQSTRRTGNT